MTVNGHGNVKVNISTKSHCTELRPSFGKFCNAPNLFYCLPVLNYNNIFVHPTYLLKATVFNQMP